MTWDKFIELVPRYKEISYWVNLTQEQWESDEKAKVATEEQIKSIAAFQLFNIDLEKQRGNCEFCGSEKTKPMHFFQSNSVRSFCHFCYETEIMGRKKEDWDPDEPKDWHRYAPEEWDVYVAKRKEQREKDLKK